jgi:phage terminase large subunit
VAKRITVASFALPHLKMGALNDWERILDFFQVDIDAVKNKSENTYRIGKSLIEFIGIEGAEAKGHGSRRNVLYINECNQRVGYDTFTQFYMRTNEVTFLDFNPCSEFWLHEKILPKVEHEFIHSTYRDNDLLSENERMNIESRKDDPAFAAWFRVYGDGLLGRFEGAIFQNWRVGEFDNSLPAIYGLDFGFNDPDALVKIAVDEGRNIIYCDEVIYKNRLSTEALTQLMLLHVRPGSLLVADCASPRTLADLRQNWRVFPAHKGKGSVVNGIKKMLSYEIVITERSKNLEHELKNYAWLDKQTGIPVSGADHLIDAVRYAFTMLTRPPQYIERVN